VEGQGGQEGQGDTPAPGWYPNPQGPGQRYWDGQKWADSYQAPQEPQRKRRGGTVWKIMLGVFLGGALLIGGCVALIGAGIEDAEKEEQEKAITNAQARSVKLGTSKSRIIARFGQPDSTQESENEGLGRDSCIYYPIKGGTLAVDRWQFCFDNRDRLTSKNRF
jgi:hypothetical protein